MSGTTSVPSVSFTTAGFVAPDEADIVIGLTADYNAAFGGNLNPAPDTPQGQLIASTAAVIGDKNSQLLKLFNEVDPAYADGRMQDGIARIYFLERLPAQATALTISSTGLAGVLIPAGALIQDTAGNLYANLADTLIAQNGTASLSFAAQTTGPTAVPALVSIYQAIPGWNTVAVTAGVVGNVVESRAVFEARRQASVAANGAGFLPAIQGAVLKVPGVIDAYTTENFTNAPVTTGGVTIAANSLYVAVSGGDPDDVAKAIWTKKPPGCGYTGNTTRTVYDTNSGYVPPYPSYAVTFQRPLSAAISFTVVMTNSSQVPSNALAQIQTTLADAFIGGDGGPRARIGGAIYASRFYAGIAALGSWAQIVDIQIGVSTSPTTTFTGVIAGTTLTVSGVTGGALAAGQFVYGTNVTPGTMIVSGSGSTWAISINQTISSEAMVSAAPLNNSVQMQINWQPTFNVADVNLVLV